jgi:hypothetical protein
MSEIDDYVQRASDMRSADKKRDILFSQIDNMWHGSWTLPKELKKPDLREIIDLSPHDALKSGTAILSTSMPHWSVQPVFSNPAERQRAENIEFAIDYNYRRMNQRGSSTFLWDVVHSCLRYDAVAIWLDFLPYQFRGGTTLRQRHALRGGDFVGTVHNPSNVHVQKDMYGINAVLLTMNMAAQAIVQKWTYRANKLNAILKDKKDTGTVRCIYNDLMLYEGNKIKRVVWCSITEGFGVEGSSDEFVIMNDYIEMPFMQWIVRVGGSGLDMAPEYSVHPLLAPLAWSHKWTDLNVFQSVLQSEIIKYGRSPRVKTITASGDGVEIDYEDGTSLNLKKGEEADAWRPSPIDPNLKELVDRVRAEVSSTTLPRILQNPEFAGNTPFASINAMIQTALGGLNPAKTLCQNAHEELAMRMVEWCFFAKKPMIAYRKKKIATEGNEPGSIVELTPDMLDPDGLMISCRLFADAPTDFAQRLQAAVTMNKELQVPREEVLEELGKTDTAASYDVWAQEQEDNVALQIDIEKQKAALTLQVEAERAKIQVAAQAAAAAAAAQQNPPPESLPQANENVEGVPEEMMPGNPTQQEQGLNPNRGAMNQPPGSVSGTPSPAAGNPGVGLREQVSGTDVTGRPVA